MQGLGIILGVCVLILLVYWILKDIRKNTTEKEKQDGDRK